MASRNLDTEIAEYRRQLSGVPPGITVEHKTARAPSVHSDALVPFLLALISALVIFLGVGLCALGIRQAVRKHWEIGLTLIITGPIPIWVWFSHLVNWRELLYTIEKITNVDIDQDGEVGQPVTHFELPTGPQSFRFGEIHLPPDLLIEWCQAAWDRQSLAYSAWEAKFALGDGTQGRERYQQFRQELVKEGFAEEVGGNVGLRVAWRNPDAVAFIGGFAHVRAEDGTPLLEG